MFHINIRNFHNNDRPNKIALTILSQLKITKVNIIEKFVKEYNKITSNHCLANKSYCPACKQLTTFQWSTQL